MRGLLFLVFAVLPGVALAEVPIVVTADLNADGLADRAVLSRNPETLDGDLTILLGTAQGGLSEAVNAPGLVWIGGIGQKPEMSVTTGGSLLVLSMNESIGRNRWRQALTIAYRSGGFRVAGFTYSWYDTLNLDDQGMCDVNLLTGKGVLELGPERRKSGFRTGLRALPVADWPGEVLPECRVGWE